MLTRHAYHIALSFKDQYIGLMKIYFIMKLDCYILALQYDV